ncbi:polysaccharide lyase family 8 super-sandwich domain-containing protein [Paenibacillus sinopodophylli]|uniref:polysaccharide lyase family 8 super-sandwich domain-containing protein n=1 Tax=Paenibacillus sinopodophylli TaxID=1837342 RepID=UPI00148683EE|nr:polysaccharide lyase family 8 super-sandwich domain-containing protein [Paenibacillus sinopodophylli]
MLMKMKVKMFGLTFKVLLIVAVWFTGIGQLGHSSVSAAGDDYEELRKKWESYLTGGEGYNAADPDIAYKLNEINQKAKNAKDSLNKTAGRTYLWYDFQSTTASKQIPGAFLRIKEMAIAYRTVGSSYYGDSEMKTDIIEALDWMYAIRYNETKTPYDNWWDWEIGAPLELNDIVILMYDDLISTPAKITNYMNTIEKFSPNPSKVNGNLVPTAANLVWKCIVVGLRGAIVQSSSKLTAVRDALSPAFDYVTSGDGFYKDGSFIQHDVYAYNGGYGASLLQNIASVMYLLNDSSWEPIVSKKNNLFQWVYDSYEPLIYNGAMMDMTRGREISRSDDQDHVTGHRIMASIIRLSQWAPAGDAARMQAMVKYWIQQDTAFNFYKDTNISVIQLAREIMNDTSIVPRGELTGAKVFAGMDQAIQLRPGFGFGVSMSSHRVGSYEMTNGENLKGWYSAAGMTYLYNQDSKQYTDFWPTVNKYRLPGTTVDTMPRTAGEGAGFLSPKTWSGGTALLGQYATAGMDLKGYGSTLTAKKSWFMFDDEIVALGAGINSFDNRMIETTIENRMLNLARVTHGMDSASPRSLPIGSEPLRHKVYAVTASEHDGNLPENTFDNNIGSRWSALGDGQWIEYDLGKVQDIGYIGINFFYQMNRYSKFNILVSEDKEEWTQVFSGNSSVVSEAQFQLFDFPDTQARYVKIVGNGNSSNKWNSINETHIYAPSSAGNVIIPPTVVPLSYAAVTDSLGSASLHSTKDGDIRTSWTSTGSGQWLKFDLGSTVQVGHAGISFPLGNERNYTFTIETSVDNTVWTSVYGGNNQGLTSEVTAYDFPDTDARYVKLVFGGNDLDLNNRISEVQLYAPSVLGPVLDPIHVTQKQKADEHLIVDGVAKPTGLGWSETMNDVSYVYLEGTGGYYFPESADIKGLRAASSGSWLDINTSGPAGTLSKNYVTLWKEHGASPVNEAYSYVLLPNQSAEETADYSSNPDIEILSNNANVQAVREVNLDVLGANFWAPSVFGYLKASNPSSIMLKDESEELNVTVSDPTRLQDKVTYEIFKSGVSVIEKDDSITVLQLTPTIKFEVDTQAKNGSSHHITFEYDSSTAVPLPTPTSPPAPPAPQDPAMLVDELDDFSHVFSRSSNLTFDRGDWKRFKGDTSRVLRKTNTNEHLIYKSAPGLEMKQFAMKAWFWDGEPAYADFDIYTSPNNADYTLFTSTKTANKVEWIEVDYTGELPAGTHYLKIVFKHSSSYVWNPQISRIEIASGKPTMIDDLNNFTKLHARSSNLYFDSSNAVKFNGDSSRLARLSNTEEYVVYKAAPDRDLSAYAVKAWFWPYEPSTDFELYASPDAAAYTLMTPDKSTVSGSWDEVNYSGELPVGTQYLKIVYKQNSSNSWNAQIGQVSITSDET